MKDQEDKKELAESKPKKGDITYVPFGENDQITLNIATIKSYIAAKTKSGKLPTDQEIVKFAMLCKARGLNPWVGDAYLVGYDGRNGPEFSLITAKQALDKRAELHPQYNGIQSGLILKTDKGIDKREGAFFLDEEKDAVVGAWSRVWRSDTEKPYYHEVKFSGERPWGNDREGGRGGGVAQGVPDADRGALLPGGNGCEGAQYHSEWNQTGWLGLVGGWWRPSTFGGTSGGGSGRGRRF